MPRAGYTPARRLALYRTLRFDPRDARMDVAYIRFAVEKDLGTLRAEVRPSARPTVRVSGTTGEL